MVVIGVALKEDAEAVKGFAREFDIPFPLLLDREGRSPLRFGLWGHPHSILIDRQGRVVGLVRGDRDWQSEAAHRLIRLLLEGKLPAGA